MVVLRDLSLSFLLSYFLLRRDDPAKHGEGSWGYRALSLWSIVAIVAFLFVMFKEHNTQHEHRTAQNTEHGAISDIRVVVVGGGEPRGLWWCTRRVSSS